MEDCCGVFKNNKIQTRVKSLILNGLLLFYYYLTSFIHLFECQFVMRMLIYYHLSLGPVNSNINKRQVLVPLKAPVTHVPVINSSFHTVWEKEYGEFFHPENSPDEVMEEENVQSILQNRPVSCCFLLSWNKHLLSLKRCSKFRTLSCVHILGDIRKTRSSLLHVKFILSKPVKSVSSWIRKMSNYCLGKEDVKMLVDNFVSPGKKLREAFPE